mmetsp:Transcript_36435/g.91704  ORF Transcript_36435/g.91704 Transcript_36435/m.91704 type:complete len:796 (-) Transcript_36435:526-2913(-)
MSPPDSGGGTNLSQTVRAFFLLVFVQTTFLLSFKLSQKGGTYKYNTASAIATTELVKCCLAAGMHWASNRSATPWFSSVHKSDVFKWAVLAIMYCINNQLTFFALMSIGPGQLTLFKSSAPMVTALMMTLLYNKHINRLQWACISLTVSGLLSVFGLPSCSTSVKDEVYGTVPLLMLSCTITSTCSVVNSKMLEQEATPLQEQNMLLYSQGFLVNLAAYILGFTPSTEVKGYLQGYSDPAVLFMLVMQSCMGLAVSYVYKHGGAIVKTLASSVQAAGLCILDVVLFGVKWTAGTIGGTVTVLIASYLYLTVALPGSGQQETEMSNSDRTCANFCVAVLVVTTLAYAGLEHHYLEVQPLHSLSSHVSGQGSLTLLQGTAKDGVGLRALSLASKPNQSMEHRARSRCPHEQLSSERGCLAETWINVTSEIRGLPEFLEAVCHACAESLSSEGVHNNPQFLRIRALGLLSRSHPYVLGQALSSIAATTKVTVIFFSYNRPEMIRTALQTFRMNVAGTTLAVTFDASLAVAHRAYALVAREFPEVAWYNRSLYGGFWKSVLAIKDREMAHTYTIAGDDMWAICPGDFRSFGAILRMLSDGPTQSTSVALQFRVSHPAWFLPPTTPRERPYFFGGVAGFPFMGAHECTESMPTRKKMTHLSSLCYDRHIDAPMYLAEQLNKEWPLLQQPRAYPVVIEGKWLDHFHPNMRFPQRRKFKLWHVDIGLYPIDQLVVNVGGWGKSAVLQSSNSIANNSEMLLSGCIQDVYSALPGLANKRKTHLDNTELLNMTWECPAIARGGV